MTDPSPGASTTLDLGTWVFISAVGCLLIIAALVVVLALAEGLDRQNDAYPARRTAPDRGHRDRAGSGTGSGTGGQTGSPVNADQAGSDDGPPEKHSERPDVERHGSDIYPELPDHYVLLEAPTLTDPLTGMPMPLRKWLVTFHPVQKQVWAELVSLFYTRAATDPGIADYFAGVEMVKLQGHFLAALVLLTGEGLDVGTVRRLHAAHRSVANTDGAPITDEIFDRTAATLAEVIADALRHTRVGPTNAPARCTRWAAWWRSSNPTSASRHQTVTGRSIDHPCTSARSAARPTRPRS